MPNALSPYLTMPEKEAVQGLLDALDWGEQRAVRVSQKAAETVRAMRGAKRRAGSVENFFRLYALDTKEGIALMALAEALLRIPDSSSASALVRDKISRTDWAAQDAANDDWLLKVAGMGLSGARSTLESPLARLGEPVIRKALAEAMKMLGSQFVLGQTISEAIKNAAVLQKEHGYLFSYDMLGEGARTQADADLYFHAYSVAIADIGAQKPLDNARTPGLSVKLSALHPRYSESQQSRCVPELSRRLGDLCRAAAQAGIFLTVDAEETERLEISLKIIESVLNDPALSGWEGFGLAVQAYGKRALPLIDTLIETAESRGRRLQIRLVKGAYWDTEIKRAQIKGLDDYPVFTRKAHTDLSYLACAQKMLRARDHVYPMFGTHNAHTVEAIIDMAANHQTGYEFQRLFGMGEALFDLVRTRDDLPVRIYAPVGKHQDLLPYLVRRLLENGANSSFVNKAFDERIAPERLAHDPVEAARMDKGHPHPSIRLPVRIFPDRVNARGLDLDDAPTRAKLLADMDRAFEKREIFCASLISGHLEKTANCWEIMNPADRRERICTAYGANTDLVDAAYTAAGKAFPVWAALPATRRAAILNKIADLYEENMPALMALSIREAGRTLADALSEVREAVDFCRYYAAQGGKLFDKNGENLRGYTGESNKILLQGRGTFVCISPWNFPLAIFTGQIVAALMAGNTVLAKPAEQTPLIAMMAVQLMHKAGIPKDVLHLVLGDGRVGEMLVSHPSCAGVAFTGSNAAALAINRTLAAKEGPIVPFIAETGGVNVLIADSSALPEQLVDDVVLSAFGSAGQRCSACRVLMLQDDIADRVIDMLRGAMAELKLGNPAFYETDIGPLIDEEALTTLQKHKSFLEGSAKIVAEAPLPETLRQQGHFFAPVAAELEDVTDLPDEVFGPALHIIRYRAKDLPAMIRAINASGYGLTFGLHTRIESRAEEIAQQVAAGNVYINRSIIGAVVGVQPFGGMGLSGTGPKAGGPHYLPAFAIEKTISINTTAAGGNAALVMLDE